MAMTESAAWPWPRFGRGSRLKALVEEVRGDDSDMRQQQARRQAEMSERAAAPVQKPSRRKARR